MTTKNEMLFAKEGNTMTIEREFAAPLAQVWAAWTQKELLDQWWAPKPYQAETKYMDFKPGGYWLYAMVGPDGSKMWARLDYKTINAQESYSAKDAFCDEDGNNAQDFPNMNWHNRFVSTPAGTKVLIEIKFAGEADMEKIIEMGFKEGFTAATQNLDDLLAK